MKEETECSTEDLLHTESYITTVIHVPLELRHTVATTPVNWFKTCYLTKVKEQSSHDTYNKYAHEKMPMKSYPTHNETPYQPAETRTNVRSRSFSHLAGKNISAPYKKGTAFSKCVRRPTCDCNPGFVRDGIECTWIVISLSLCAGFINVYHLLLNWRSHFTNEEGTGTSKFWQSLLGLLQWTGGKLA